MHDIFKNFSEFDLGIDLGSSFIKIFVEGKGILFFEPSVIARQRKRNGQVIAVGKKAAVMIGKEPAQIQVIEPIRHGVIADFDATLLLVEHLFNLIKQTPGRWLKIFGSRVIAAVYSGATEVERRAVKAIFVKNGSRDVYLIERPLAAAIGLGLPVESSGGSLLMDIGGETTEMAVICLGGIVLNRQLPIGGKQFDEAIINFIRLKYGVLIGRLTAEKVKKQLGLVYPGEATLHSQMVIRGRGLENGLPQSLRIRKEEVMEAILPLAQRIVASLDDLLEETPAELTDDILKTGIALTGGSANIAGWDKIVREVTKMPAWVAKKPAESVSRGCGQLLQQKALLNRVKLVSGLK